jgi:hypothetical protein
MKNRNRLIYATLLFPLMLASCKNEEEEIAGGDNRMENVIDFTARESSGGALRSTGDLTTANLDTMAVYAYYTGTQDIAATHTPNFMFNQSVVKDAGVWTYSPVMYWPDQGHKVSFFAISPAPDGTVIVGPGNPDAAGYPAFTINTPAETELMPDICVASSMNNISTGSNTKVSFSFQHTTAKVTFSARYKGNMPITKGYVKIKTFSWSAGMVQSATLRLAGSTFEWADLAPAAPYTLSEANAYFNTANLPEENATGDSRLFGDSATLLFIPQTIAASNVTFTASLYNRLDVPLVDYGVSKTLPARTLDAGSHTGYVIKVDLDKDRTVWQYTYTGAAQTFIVPEDGIYLLEAHGANGYAGAPGGHVSGKTVLKKGTRLHLYVGEKSGSFNGGGTKASGSAAYVGGGATDFRLVSGGWNNAASLNSRILIAGGGSGAGTAGYGGGLVGGEANGGYGGTQTAGGERIGAACWGGGWTGGYGAFAVGGRSGWSEGNGGGGGGYYGGGGGSDCNANNQGGGGSSFISGFTGCVAIDPASTSNPRDQDTGTNPTALNYSVSRFGSANPTSWTDGDEILFDDPEMIDGAGYKWEYGAREGTPTGVMPTPPDDITQAGSGYARITRIG